MARKYAAERSAGYADVFRGMDELLIGVWMKNVH